MSVMHTVERSNRVIVDHFRCPDDFTNIGVWGELSREIGFFEFGSELICYWPIPSTVIRMIWIG